MMDPDRRQMLEKRREQLAADIALRERRDLVRRETDLLDRRAIRYGFEYDPMPFYRWIESRFPTTRPDGWIDWSQVARSSHLSHGAETPASAWLRHIQERLDSGPAKVVVVWSNAHRPGLWIRFRDLVTCPELLADDWETWTICEAGRWVVEFTLERGWYWGTAPERSGETIVPRTP
jgi:hypothetical protein